MDDEEDLFKCFSLPSYCVTSVVNLKYPTTQKMCRISATLLMNQEDCEQMEVHRNCWFVFELSIRKKSRELKLLKLVHVIRLSEIKCNEILLSDEMLCNITNKLDSNDGKFKSSVALRVKSQRTKLNIDFMPYRANKVTICSIAHDEILERELLDSSLMGYFQTPCYLSKGDVIALNISKYIPEVLFDFSKHNVNVYFKIVEIDGPSYNIESLKTVECGYIIDKNTALYQVSCQQGFLPHYKYRFIPNISKIELHNLKQAYPPLLPLSFMQKFEVLTSWFQQFMKKECQELKLNPFFLLHGPHGVGKSLLLSSICTYIGIGYVKFSCNNCEGLAPGQGEGKIKALFMQVKERSPCILQLENIEALCCNAEGEEDVRTLSCLKNQIESLKCDFPVVVIATTSNLEAVKPNLVQQFLQTLQIDNPNAEQRMDILQWIFHCCNYTVNIELLKQVAAQTAGFLFTDLTELVALAYRERIRKLKCIDIEHSELGEFELNDFTTAIATMQSAFSEAIGAPKIPNVKWEDIGGLSDLKEEILCSLQSTQWDTELKRSGLLLYGPPGTGKTLLAKAVATECGRNFLSVKGPELLNMYVGQSEQNIRKVFEVARSASPCIVFFDELDSLAPNRGRSGDSGGVMDRVVSQLLAEMDGLSTSGDVFILGATNRPDLIDPAIRRPGRLDKMLYVGPCTDRESQISVFKALTRKFLLAEEVDLSSIANMIPQSVTGADIYAVCSAAWVNAARRVIQSIEEQKIHSEKTPDEKKKEVIVEQEDFINAVKICKYSTKL